ncbi:MAG: alpha/beta hydrolase [Pseudomonadota bacterium]
MATKQAETATAPAAAAKSARPAPESAGDKKSAPRRRSGTIEPPAPPPPPKEQSITAQDGVKLFVKTYAPPPNSPEKPPVLCLPGLSRNGRDFEELATWLSSAEGGRRRIITLDYRGRGRSGHDRRWQNYTLATETADIIDIMTALNIEHTHVVGTSRGGLIAMLIGALRPGLLKSVILNDVGPRVESQGLVRIKRMLNEPPQPASFVEAAGMLKRMLEAVFPVLTQEDWEAYAHRTFVATDKGLAMDFDPKLAKTLDPIEADTPTPEAWHLFETLKPVPVLCLRAEHSDILSTETVNKMRRRHANFTTMTVSGMGHAPMLRDHATMSRISEFLGEAEIAQPAAA